MITKENIETILLSNLENTEIADKVLEVLKPFDGKTISKRMASAVQKALPEYTIYYKSDYGMFHINVWGNGISYNEMLSFLIGYETNTTFNFETFRDRFANCYLGAAKERNNKRKLWLSSEYSIQGAVDRINEINRLKKELDNLLSDCPDSFQIEKLVE